MKNRISRTEFHDRVFDLLIPATAFMIPVFIRAVPLLIILLGLNWLLEGAWIGNIRGIFREDKRVQLLCFSVIYLLYFAGMAWSANRVYGWSDLETKLSILIFPLMMATRKSVSMDREQTSRMLNGFVYGCLAGIVLLTGHAWIVFLRGKSSDAFFYSNLSWFNHSSYMAMYVSFAAAVLAGKFVTAALNRTFHRMAPQILLFLVFMVFTALLSSKAGYLSFMVVIVYFSLHYALCTKRFITGTVTAILGITLFIAIVFLLPFSGNRLTQAGNDMNQPEAKGADMRSTGERMAILKVSLDLVREHWLFGVGTGDVKDSLVEHYRINDLEKVYHQRLNAHNQYLQTIIAIGVPGFLVLTGMLLLPAILAFRRNHPVYLALLALFALNLLFESMFESQAGVIFYAFLNTMLFASLGPPPIREDLITT